MARGTLRHGPHPQQWRILGVRFANGLTLERAQVSPDFAPGGGRLVVHMEWSGDPAALTGGEKFLPPPARRVGQPGRPVGS